MWRADDRAGPAGRARIGVQSQKANLRLRRPSDLAIGGIGSGIGWPRVGRCRAEVDLQHRGQIADPDQGQQHATGGAGRLASWRRGGSSLRNSTPRSTSSRARAPAAGHRPVAHRSRAPGRRGRRSPRDREPGQRPNLDALAALAPDPLAGQLQLGAMADRPGGGQRFLVVPARRLAPAPANVRDYPGGGKPWEGCRPSPGGGPWRSSTP